LRRAKRDASLAFCLKPGRGNSFWVLDCEAIPESDQSIPSQEISRVVKTKGQAFFNGGTKSPELEPERVAGVPNACPAAISMAAQFRSEKSPTLKRAWQTGIEV